MIDIINKYLDRILIIITIILIISLIILNLFDIKIKDNSNELVTNTNENTLLEKDETEENEVLGVADEFINIDIKGAIKNPGVYNLKNGSLVSDAIELAGGLNSNATTKNINLSKKLTDEMVIYIYTKSELKKLTTTSSSNTSTNSISETSDVYNYTESALVDSSSNNTNSSSSNSNTETKSSSTTTNNKISINTASKEELMTLSGIGEAKALAIISYRETNGYFKSIEDIMNVSGIGESLYNKIKDSITV